jgi:hypothetical protein
MNRPHLIQCLAATCSFILFSMSMNAYATLYDIKLTAINTNGFGKCQATFNINAAGAFTINNINVRVGGSSSIEDPGHWQLFSPMNTTMPLTIFGFNVTTATHKWYEYNTSHHDGPLDAGLWELLFDEPAGGCAQYSAVLIFDAT